MKKTLLLLCALILAAPAWAADTAGTQTTKQTTTTSTEQAVPAPTAQPGTDTVTVTCPVQCKTMYCPPPGGPLRVCCPVAPYTQTCP